MKDSNKTIKVDKYLFLCILFTIFGFLIIFYMSDIYPMGSNHINMIDFDNGYIPVYYKLWDILHFKSSALWDWNLGTGLNCFGSLIGNGLISPLCWVIALFPRSSISYTISYVYLLKMVFVSVMTYFAIGKLLPNSKRKHRLLFTLMYTFSSWTFMMSTNLQYLDSVAIFPMLVYALKELLENGHWKLYTFLLTITLMMSYYIAWLDLLFIICFVGCYLILIKPNDLKKKATKVLICTLLSLLFSCIILLPGIMFTKNSTRVLNNTSNSNIFDYFMEKSIYLFTLSIPLVLTIKQLFVKKDKKINTFIISLLVLLLIGVFIEPINALWHTGSHYGFPFRYAYQPTFIMIFVGIYYLTNNHKYCSKTSWINIVIPIIGLIIIFTSFVIIGPELYEHNVFSVSVTSIEDYIKVLLFFIGLTIIYWIIIKNKEKIFFALTIFLFIVTTIIYGILYEQLIVSMQNSSLMEKISDSFKLKNDGYNYMMELDYANVNFPYIIKSPSMTNRIHFISQDFLDEIKYLGYEYYDTIIEARCGNQFNNLLLQNKYYLTKDNMDEKYYELLEEHDGIKYYQSKYNLNYLIPYNGNNYSEKNNDMYDNSNQIYKKLFNGENDIYIKQNYSNNDNELSFEVKKDKRYELGIVSNEKEVFDNDNINITYHFYDIYNNKYQKISFISNITGTISFKTIGTIKEIYVYEFNEEEFENFVNNYSYDTKLEIDNTKKTYLLDIPKDTSILLPINYDNNYIIKVNGKKVDYKLNLYNMISIDVERGINKIEVSYNHKWFKYGIAITIGSLILFAILMVLNKKYQFLKHKIIVLPLYVLSIIIFLIFILKIYLLPLL